MLNKESIKVPCKLGETVWVKLGIEKSIHSGVLLGLKVDEDNTEVMNYLVKVLDTDKSFVKKPIDITFSKYFNTIYSRKEAEKINELLDMGWDLDDYDKGYGLFTSDEDSIIPDALIVQKIDEVDKFESDWDACRQAEKDGVLFINDIDGLEKGCYIDTKENREYCENFIKEHPEYRIENLIKNTDIDPEYWQNYNKKFMTIQ